MPEADSVPPSPPPPGVGKDTFHSTRSISVLLWMLKIKRLPEQPWASSMPLMVVGPSQSRVGCVEGGEGSARAPIRRPVMTLRMIVVVGQVKDAKYTRPGLIATYATHLQQRGDTW